MNFFLSVIIIYSNDLKIVDKTANSTDFITFPSCLNGSLILIAHASPNWSCFCSNVVVFQFILQIFYMWSINTHCNFFLTVNYFKGGTKLIVTWLGLIIIVNSVIFKAR